MINCLWPAEKNPDKYGGIPPQVFSLVRLRTLSLGCQAIRFVPSEIKRLPRLTILVLADNPFLEVVSGEVGQCSGQLSTLFTYKNH